MYDGFYKDLLTELYSVHKNMEISLTEIYEMPVMYRRDLIKTHNKIMEEEKEKYESKAT